jgi:hypothetical protein
MKIMVVLLLVILVGIGYCGHSRNQKPLVGNYDLQGRDYSGKLIFNGAIRITSFENMELNGTCKVVELDHRFEGAVNKNNGPCEGKVSGDEITLDLAPDLDDGGLVFEGHWNESRITGTWMIESVLGGERLGTFEAVKR